MITNKMYDILRWACQLVIPGLAALYFALSGLWNFPYPNEIVGTLMAIAAFLGALLGLNAMTYFTKQKHIEIEEAIDASWKDNEGSGNISNNRFINQMPEQVYLTLKWISLTVLPALATLYAAISLLWNLAYAEQIVGTIAAVTSFLGLLLGISSIKLDTSQVLESQ